MFDARLAGLPVEGDTKLRHWKRIVGTLYLDFVERLPEAKAPTLGLLARREDGRVEGSRYPNLIHPWERVQYGI